MDDRRHAPATHRNREPILHVLRRVLPKHPTVLELASGSGEHALYFASEIPGVTWIPSDPDPTAQASIRAWTRGVPGIGDPIPLDARAWPWPVERVDAVVCINMIHISPWAATEGLMHGGARVLPDGGVLVIYGPFARGGAHTAPSNAAFDRDLRSRDPEWGVRDLEDVIALAEAEGLTHEETVEMPANNLTVVFRKR